METNNSDERARQYRLERLAEYGVTEEQMAKIKALLESKNYRVDTDFFISVQPIYKNWNDQPRARVEFTNDLFQLGTSGSQWQFAEAKKIQAEVNASIEILEQIALIAPTLVDPTFRDTRRKEASDAAKKHTLELIEKWNALPEIETVLELSDGSKLVRKRSKVEYRKNYSESYNREFWLGFELQGRHFYPKDYITDANAVQRKKFLHEFRDLPSGDAQAILELLPELLKQHRSAKNGNIV